MEVDASADVLGVHSKGSFDVDIHSLGFIVVKQLCVGYVVCLCLRR